MLSAQLVLVAEFLRYGAWFVVLTGLMRGAGLGQRLGQVAHLVWIGSVVLLVAAPALARLGIGLLEPAGLLGHAGLVLSLLALVLLEQIYRNTREGGRFALKLFVIAAGLMFAYDLFLYSQAQLTNEHRSRDLGRARFRDPADGADARHRGAPQSAMVAECLRIAPRRLLHHVVHGHRRLPAADGVRRLPDPVLRRHLGRGRRSSCSSRAPAWCC